MDLTGGMSDEFDAVLAETPEDPRVREGDNVWVFDDEGRFTLPRFGVEAAGATWDQRGLQANVGFPDGRALNGAGAAPAIDPRGADGVARVFGAGPCRLECVVPFENWTVSWHGPMRDTTVAEQLAGVVSERRVMVDIDIDTRMAVPPWVQGTMSTEAGAMMTDTVEAVFMGGARHEQLFRCSGRFRVEGSEPIEFTGTGLRIHRVGIRDTTEFWGHNWQSALFPSGRAFGFITFPPRPDGSPSYAEAYVFDGGSMHPARIVEVQWLTAVVPTGGDVSVVLATEAHGEIRIEGRTYGSTFSVQGNSLHLEWPPPHGHPNPVTFHQGGAVYTWDGETTRGMVERSLPEHRIDRSAT